MKHDLTSEEVALIDRDQVELRRILSVAKHFLMTSHGREYFAQEYDRAADYHEGGRARHSRDIAAALRGA